MSLSFLSDQLSNLGPTTKENRDRVANIVLESPTLFEELIYSTFQVEDKLSIKAAWILEWITTHHGIHHLYPHLNYFTKGISKLQFDSSIRPCAKICEQLAIAYDEKNDQQLTSTRINEIVETGFEWLITPQKIAVRAYTMNMLFIFGKNIEWIHPELKHLISSKIKHESKGCEARGKYVLKAIEKHRNSTR